MKIKPRAKLLNEALRSKRNTRHKTLKKPSRQKLKRDLKKEIKDA